MMDGIASRVIFFEPCGLNRKDLLDGPSPVVELFSPPDRATGNKATFSGTEERRTPY